MVEFLSQEWFDQLVADAAATAGDTGGDADSGDPGQDVSMLVQNLVTGGPDGDVSFWTKIERGRTVEVGQGDVDKPDLTLIAAYEDAERQAAGEVEPSAAYMQGRLKAEGDMTKLFALLKGTHTPR
jgi:SCP-2 sterol transfer family